LLLHEQLHLCCGLCLLLGPSLLGSTHAVQKNSQNDTRPACYQVQAVIGLRLVAGFSHTDRYRGFRHIRIVHNTELSCEVRRRCRRVGRQRHKRFYRACPNTRVRPAKVGLRGRRREILKVYRRRELIGRTAPQATSPPASPSGRATIRVADHDVYSVGKWVPSLEIDRGAGLELCPER
jgi:hypothetical protein